MKFQQKEMKFQQSIQTIVKVSTKKELFAECKTDKEKKALRIKLRKKLYNFFATFLQVEKNPQKLNELKKLWKDYAKDVYLDVSDIIENNAKEDNIKLAKRFLSAINK